jgi:hypothetical protein
MTMTTTTTTTVAMISTWQRVSRGACFGPPLTSDGHSRSSQGCLHTHALCRALSPQRVMPAHGTICAGLLAAAMMLVHALGRGPFVVARHACTCPPSGPLAAGIWVCAPPLPLPWAAMPWALQSWLPQPRLQARGQASSSLGRERRRVCSWQCFPDCGRDRDNDNASTIANAITMTRLRWLRQCRRQPNDDGRNDASTTTTAVSHA